MRLPETCFELWQFLITGFARSLHKNAFWDKQHSTISPRKCVQHLPHFGHQLSPGEAHKKQQQTATAANSIKLWNYLKTRSKHQTNCGGILLAKLFSRGPNRSFNGCFRFAVRYGSSTSVASSLPPALEN